MQLSSHEEFYRIMWVDIFHWKAFFNFKTSLISIELKGFKKNSKKWVDLDSLGGAFKDLELRLDL